MTPYSAAVRGGGSHYHRRVLLVAALPFALAIGTSAAMVADMRTSKCRALILAALGSTMVSHAAAFLSITDNSASGATPWTLGVLFAVPAGAGFWVNDLQVFDNAVGNTLRIGLWSATGNSPIYQTTIPLSSGAGGFVSVGNAPFPLPAGSYVLAASGFAQPSSFGDTAAADTGPTYLNLGDFSLNSVGDLFALITDPTTINPLDPGHGSATANARWKSVNFTYQTGVVPEASTLGAMGAMVGIGLLCYRRHAAGRNA